MQTYNVTTAETRLRCFNVGGARPVDNSVVFFAQKNRTVV